MQLGNLKYYKTLLHYANVKKKVLTETRIYIYILLFYFIILLFAPGIQNNIAIRHLHTSYSDKPPKSTTHMTPYIAVKIPLSISPILYFILCDYICVYIYI